MNQDIRIAVAFLDHPKTIKLYRRLGSDAVLCLIRLWCYAAQHKPTGVLSGMDVEDIEIASKWLGEAGKFSEAILQLGFLKDTDETLSLHDWEEHNPYAFHAKDRKARAKKAAAARYAKRLPVAEYKQDDSKQEALLNDDSAPAPSPVPSPSPIPSPSPMERAVAITLPLNTNEEFPIFEDQIAEWGKLFPSANVLQELRGMRAWCLAKPKRRKTRRGVLAFVTSWLSKAQDEAKPNGGAYAPHQRIDNSAPARVQRAIDAKNQGRIIEGKAD